MLRSALVTLAFAAVAAAPSVGQRLAAPFPRWEPSLQSVARPPKTRVPDYRWEGLAVGGAFVGLLGGALGHGFCCYDDGGAGGSCLWPTVEGFIVGAVVGGVTGGLLGSAIHKPPPDDPGHP